MRIQSLQCNGDGSCKVKNEINIETKLAKWDYQQIVIGVSQMIKDYEYVLYHDKQLNRFFKIDSVELYGTDGDLLVLVFVQIKNTDIIPAIRYSYQIPLAEDIIMDIMCFNKTRESEED